MCSTAGSINILLQVFWLQTGTLFGDLRIPQALHNAMPADLDSCEPQHLLALAEQRASIGTIRLDKDECQWHSDLEYQPLGGPPDIGKLDVQSPTKAQYGLHSTLILCMSSWKMLVYPAACLQNPGGLRSRQA